MADIDTLTAMTGAGGTVTLGGELLTLHQLSYEDISKIREWARDKMPRPMNLFIEEMKQLLPLKEFDPDGYERTRQQLILQAHEDEQLIKSGGTPAHALEVAAASSEGIAYMLWLSTRQDHPGETVASLQKKLNSENIGDIKAKLDRINLAWVPKKEQPSGPPVSGAPLPG